jgi:hypothetical protein
MNNSGKIKVGDKVKYNGYEYFVEGITQGNEQEAYYILSNPKKYGHIKEYVTINKIKPRTYDKNR